MHQKHEVLNVTDRGEGQEAIIRGCDCFDIERSSQMRFDYRKHGEFRWVVLTRCETSAIILSTRFVLLRRNYAPAKDSATRVYEIALSLYSMEAYKRFPKQLANHMLGVDTKTVLFVLLDENT